MVKFCPADVTRVYRLVTELAICCNLKPGCAAERTDSEGQRASGGGATDKN